MLKIYGVPISVHTRKALVAARAKQIPFECVPVSPFAPPPDWDALSPTGKIPVIADGDFTVPDSSAICAYLERRHPAPALYPAEPRALATALWLEEYADGTLFPTVVHGLFLQKAIRPNMLKQETDAAAVAAIESQALPKAFGYLEGRAAAGDLAADRLGIAELAVACNLVNLHYLGYAIDARRYPKLAAFFRRQVALPAMAAALAAEQPVAAQMGLDHGFPGAAAAA